MPGRLCSLRVAPSPLPLQGRVLGMHLCVRWTWVPPHPDLRRSWELPPPALGPSPLGRSWPHTAWNALTTQAKTQRDGPWAVSPSPADIWPPCGNHTAGRLHRASHVGTGLPRVSSSHGPCPDDPGPGASMAFLRGPRGDKHCAGVQAAIVHQLSGDTPQFVPSRKELAQG